MTRQISFSGALLAVFVGSTLALAQPVASASGHWEGSIQVPGQELKVEIDLAQTAAKWEGAIAIPAQSMKGFPLSEITVQGESVSFVLKGIPGQPQFTGTVSKDGKALSGDFTQGGGNFPFALTRTGDAKFEPAPKSTPVTKDLEGSWEGALSVDGATLRLVLKLANQAAVGATGTLVSLDQGNAEIPLGAVVQTGTKLKVHVPAVLGMYEGELKDGQLTGTWTQGPRSMPLTLTRQK
jgi:hypothetical protein